MKKKYLAIILVLICFSTLTWPGDIPEGIMLGKHKALIIGKLSIKEDIYTIEPSTVMMGEVLDEEVTVNKFDIYYGSNDKPLDGDIIVAVLVDDHQIDDTWVFKCTSNNYKTLKLVSERHNMVERYEKYINDGEYFKAQQRLDESKATSVEDTPTGSDQVLNTNVTVEEPINEQQSNVLVIAVLILVCIVFILCIMLKRIKNRVN
jgi:hypothetical protein